MYYQGYYSEEGALRITEISAESVELLGDATDNYTEPWPVSEGTTEDNLTE